MLTDEHPLIRDAIRTSQDERRPCVCRSGFAAFVDGRGPRLETVWCSSAGTSLLSSALSVGTRSSSRRAVRLSRRLAPSEPWGRFRSRKNARQRARTREGRKARREASAAR